MRRVSLVILGALGLVWADTYRGTSALTVEGVQRVYSATVRPRATAWRVPPELLPPPDAAEHDFYWQVQVVQETTDAEGQVVYHRAGLPSEIRTFTWLPATPTPAPARPSPTP